MQIWHYSTVKCYFFKHCKLCYRRFIYKKRGRCEAPPHFFLDCLAHCISSPTTLSDDSQPCARSSTLGNKANQFTFSVCFYCEINIIFINHIYYTFDR